MMKKWIRPLVGIFISVALTWMLVSKLDWDQFFMYLRPLNFTILAAAVVIQSISYYWRSWRWQWIQFPVKSPGVPSLYSTLAISYMLNTVLPLRLGDVGRVIIITRQGNATVAQSISALLVERGFDAVAIVLIGSIAAYILNLPLGFVSVAVVIATGAIIVLYGLLVWKPDPVRVRQWIFRLIRKDKVADKVAELVSRFNLRISTRDVWRIFFLSVLVWFTEAAGYFLIGIAFGFSWTPVAALFTMAVVNIATMIPSSPGYVGTFQYMTVLALSQFLVPFNEAMAYSVVTHILIFTPITLIGYICFWRSDLKMKALNTGLTGE